jgi:hypothetical protein
MLIPSEESSLFFRLYPSVIGFAAKQAGGIAGITDANTFKSASIDSRIQARGHLLDHIELISEYIEKNPDEFREKELGHITTWSHFIKGKFIMERNLKNHTVFLLDSSPPKAYGVLGLGDEIVDMMPRPLPMFVEAVLLPWKGVIVCDGLLSSYNLSFGGGIKNGFRESYREAKASGIITSLDPDWKPEEPKQTQKPKTPAIVRFIKNKCPKTVTQFKLKYGEPRMDMAGEAACEYSTWNMDGKSAIDVDYLMLYANIIRHQVLYVYAKEGNITHITVVDPTDWDSKDFKPYVGNRLMS